jgi:hypothetical protein
LDHDEAIQEEVKNTARALLEGVQNVRNGKQIHPGSQLKPPRQK